MSDPSGNAIIDVARVELTEYKIADFANLDQYNAVSKQQVEWVRDLLSGDLATEVDALNTAIDALQSELSGDIFVAQTEIQAQIDTLSGDLETLSGIVETNRSDLSGDILELTNIVISNYNDLSGKITTLSGLHKILDDKVDAEFSELSGFVNQQIVDLVGGAEVNFDTLHEIAEYIKLLSGDLANNVVTQQSNLTTEVDNLSGVLDALSGRMDLDFFRKRGGNVHGNTTFQAREGNVEEGAAVGPVIMKVDFTNDKVEFVNATTVIDNGKVKSDRIDINNYLYMGAAKKWRINPAADGSSIAFEYNPYQFLSGEAETKKTKFRMF
jgi:hypothetical protein